MILVTGGTGFVGSAVVERLLGAGRRVRVLSRSQPREPRVEWVQGDVTDPAAVGRAVAGCSHVVHLVAIRRQWRDRTFAAVTAGGGRNVAEAARRAGVERLVHVSALGVSDRPETGYMRAKKEAEDAVRRSGLEHVILRPSFIVGPGGFVAEYGRIIMRAPVVPVPGGGRFPVQPVARSDVALAVERALTEPKAAGRVYDLAGPERVTFGEFIARIMRAMGVKKPLVGVPVGVMRAVAAILEPVTPNPPATRDEIRMLLAGNVGDPGPACADLGLELTPLDRALADAVAGLGWSRPGGGR